MPTDRVSPPSRLAGVMRALAQGRTTAAGRGAASTAPESTSVPTPSASPHAVDALRQRLRNIVENIDAGDAGSLAAVREPILREILLWEFGSDFRKDSQFLPMVDAIAKSLDANPGFQAQFVALVEGLQA